MERIDLFRNNEAGEDYSPTGGVIFLDIDGVLRHINNQERFSHNLDALVNLLVGKYNDDIYKTIDKYDVAAAFYEFDYAAIGILKKIVEETGAKIVISSDWKNSKDLKQLKALFRLYGLEDAVVDTCKAMPGAKAEAIKQYIVEHKIKDYIVVDDQDYTEKFGMRFRKIDDLLDSEDMKYIMMVLCGLTVNATKDDSYMSFNVYGMSSSFKYKEMNIDENKVLYLRLAYWDCLFNFNRKIVLEFILNYLYVESKYDAIILDMNNINIYDLVASGRYYHDCYVLDRTDLDYDDIEEITNSVIGL